MDAMIATKEQLEKLTELKSDEEAWFENPSSLPFLISDSLEKLIDFKDENDPIRRELVPSCRECQDEGSIDPLKEEQNSVSSRLIHRYTHRVALLTTDRCFAYCRHCFRRRFTGSMTGPISDREIEEAAGYLKEHREVYEVLLTGGDLFTLSNERLEKLFKALRDCRDDLILRLCTRATVSMPGRFDDETMKLIAKYNYNGPFFLLTHYNHPRELTDESLAAVKKFVSLGIPVFNQSVLLRLVNDNVDTLEELCIKLLKNCIKPYYLFQCDLVKGTAHLRVDISRGLEIERELRRRLSGLAMPQYTSDLPDGGGKIILTSSHLKGKEDGCYILENLDGEMRKYPAGEE